MRTKIKQLLCALALMAGMTQSAWAEVGNVVQSGLFSGAVSGTVATAQLTNGAFRGGHILIDVSGYISGTVTVHIQGYNLNTAGYYDILVSPAISSDGTTILKVYPGIGAIANGAASDILPKLWRVQLVGAASPDMNVDVSAYLEP